MRAVAVGEPHNLRDFGGGLDGASVARGPVAAHAHAHVGGVAVGGCFEGAGVGEAGGVEQAGQLFLDFAQQGLGISFARLALAAGQVMLLTAIAFNLQKLLKHQSKQLLRLAIALPKTPLEGPFLPF